MNESTVNTEMISMQLITTAGEARTLAFEALKEAKEGNYEEAKVKVELANKAVEKSHQIQTGLLVSFAKEEHIDVNVLLIHAQDHLMTCMLAIEVIQEIIEVYENLNGKVDK